MQKIKTIENNQSNIEQKILELLPIITYSELKSIVGENGITQWLDFCMENDFIHKKEKKYSANIKSLIKNNSYRVRKYRDQLKQFNLTKKNYYNLPYYSAYLIKNDKYLTVLAERDKYPYSERVLLKQEIKEYEAFKKGMNLIKNYVENIIEQKKNILPESQIKKIRKTLNNFILNNRNYIQDNFLNKRLLAMVNKQIDKYQKAEKKFNNLQNTIEQLTKQKDSIEDKIKELTEQKALLMKKNQKKQEQAFIWAVIGDALGSLFLSDFSDISKN